MVDNTRQRIRKLVEKHGATSAARLLQMPRESVLAVAAGAKVRAGTIALAEKQLAALGDAP